MRDHKTTIAAAISAIFGFIALNPHYLEHYPLLIDIAKYAHIGGLAAFGILASDSNSTRKKT